MWVQACVILALALETASRWIHHWFMVGAPKR